MENHHTHSGKTDIAKVFWSGNSQAVRLPKSFRFDADEVDIMRVGDGVLMTPKPARKSGSKETKTANPFWKSFFASYDPGELDEFMKDRPLNVLPGSREERDLF